MKKNLFTPIDQVIFIGCFCLFIIYIITSNINTSINKYEYPEIIQKDTLFDTIEYIIRRENGIHLTCKALNVFNVGDTCTYNYKALHEGYDIRNQYVIIIAKKKIPP